MIDDVEDVEEEVNYWYHHIYTFTQRLLFYVSEGEIQKGRKFFYSQLPSLIPILDKNFIYNSLIQSAYDDEVFFIHIHNLYEQIARQQGHFLYKIDMSKVVNEPVAYKLGYGKILDYDVLKHDFMQSYYKMIRRDKPQQQIYEYISYCSQIFSQLLDKSFYMNQHNIQSQFQTITEKNELLLHALISCFERRSMFPKQKVVIIYPPNSDTPKYKEEVISDV